ncbi:MAG TPA: hypothetical protein VHU90_07150 [Galbitalea sp.]|nr:hypothetical protein [Galbitalea sp.]
MRHAPLAAVAAWAPPKTPDELYYKAAMTAAWHFGKRLGLKEVAGLPYSRDHYEEVLWGSEGHLGVAGWASSSVSTSEVMRAHVRAVRRASLRLMELAGVRAR